MPARLVTVAAVMLAGCLDAVSGSTCALNPALADSEVAAIPNRVIAGPSRLDYLALASMADAQRPLAMAGYRPSISPPQAVE